MTWEFKKNNGTQPVADDVMVEDLQVTMQYAAENEELVQFVAAGGADPQVWFYKLV